jgi:hypothetical protein
MNTQLNLGASRPSPDRAEKGYATHMETCT